MTVVELLLLAIALAMDAFAVSVCKGLALGKVTWKHMVIVGAWFGGFQALMPLLGFFLGKTFVSYMQAFDHWVSFALLVLIGANMIKEALSKEEKPETASLGFRGMLLLAIATSIDALAVGITFAAEIKTIPLLALGIGLIGIVTFVISGIGVRLGSLVGTKYKAKAELTGGIILILLGIKLLIEGLL